MRWWEKLTFLLFDLPLQYMLQLEPMMVVITQVMNSVETG
jgi:hypothetical protein